MNNDNHILWYIFYILNYNTLVSLVFHLCLILYRSPSQKSELKCGVSAKYIPDLEELIWKGKCIISHLFVWRWKSNTLGLWV